MKNPFNHENYPSNRIKRNSFPLSFQYNGTFEYGKIYPVGLIRVPNAGTYKIEPTLALNFMPTVFPVQTRQKAYLHFFYGRDRNFWNEYKDFVHGLKPNLVKPYLDESVTQARTGNLLDYLGVPTTIVGKYGNLESVLDLSNDSLGDAKVLNLASSISTQPHTSASNITLDEVNEFPSSVLGSVVGEIQDVNSSFSGSNYLCCYEFSSELYADSFSACDVQYQLINNELESDGSQLIKDVFGVNYKYTIDGYMSSDLPESLVFDSANYNYLSPLPRFELYKSTFVLVLDSENKVTNVGMPISLQNGKVRYSFDTNVTEYSRIILVSPFNVVDYRKEGGQIYDTLPAYNSFIAFQGNIGRKTVVNAISMSLLSPFDSIVRDIDETTSPYWRSGVTTDLRERIKLNAIPCRMYETIYNLYYRNPQNNPYILNGVPEYNIFTPTLDGGVDNNLYQLRYRNWADDFLTTATQTPQQGIAPLVGLTDRGATITLTNEDGSITRYKTTLDDDGNLTGIETTDSSEPILTQALVDAVTYGISIEDIRNVNKMQKWLELNLRKGYQYKDVIEARWGISISYNELNLPEFIGGFTQEVSMQAVTQTANIDDTVTGQLGWQAGRMYCAKDGREITHYCDEAGYIMVLLSVAPMPNYSQLLPKHWFTRDLLEEYQPEFNHIGFQPITYKEVCPVQAYQESTETNNVLEQTFGYQRPWYEYMSMPDEVHGQFRTSLKDYLINRVFDVKPELSESFLLVDPEQINDVFNVTESDDKILGAINYNIVAKLPISEYANATIE